MGCSSPAALAFGVFAGLALCACTEFASPTDILAQDQGNLSGEEQLETSSPARFTADWSCLGSAQPDEPRAPNAQTYAYTVPIVSPAGFALPQANVTLCSRLDVTCDEPLARVSPNEDGLVQFVVPDGFEGFFNIEAMGVLPLVQHMRLRVTENTLDRRPIIMFPSAALRPIAEANGLDLIEEAAIAAATVIDCSGERAAGVSLSNSVGGFEFYFVGGLPVIDDDTDSQGFGGFLNVQPVAVELRAYVASTGQFIGSRQIIARGGWVNVVQIAPGMR